MGLKDFDASKLRNFRYDSIGAESKTPQTFGDDHSGTTVTGARDKILEQFLNPGEPITVNTGASVFDDTNPPTPQTYTISHAGGEATISGLKGSVNFDGIDDLKSKSIIISTWANLVDNNQLFSYMSRPIVEDYPGHNDKVVNNLNFGVNSVDTNPERIFTQSPRIGYTVQLQRGGGNADRIADNYADLVGGAGDMYTRFLNKRLERQASFHIMQGTVDSGTGPDAEFGTFDPIGLQAGFYPGIRGVSIGSAIFGKPSYIKNTPKIDNQTYTDVTQFAFVDYQAGDMSSFNPAEESKMLYLYRNFILTDNDAEGPGGFWATAAAYWDNVSTPFPVFPSQNVVKSIPYTNTNTFWNGGLLDASSAEDKRQYVADAFNGEIEGEDDGFQFFSRFKPTTTIYDNLEAKLAEPTAKWDFEGPDGTQLFPRKGIPLHVSRSLSGENRLHDFNQGVNNLAHKYATLGFHQLDQANSYGQSLITPGEQNNQARRVAMEEQGLIEHMDGTSPGPKEEVPAVPKGGARLEGRTKAVSYTHLTLPTNREV